MGWADQNYIRRVKVNCLRHIFVEMARRNGNVVALCPTCRERIEVPTVEFDDMFRLGQAVGKPVRL